MRSMRIATMVAALAAALTTACGASSRTAAEPAGGAAATHASSAASTSSSTSTAPSPKRALVRRAGVGVVSTHRAAAFPRPAHIVVVVMENHSYADIIGSVSAPYINSLTARGKSLTQMYAVTHPSQPNYLALFSGSQQGIVDDSCPRYIAGASLGSELLAARRSFVGYSEGLPSAGSRTCYAGSYARKHAPWVDFVNLPARVNQPLTAFPTDFTKLPTVSFVIPTLAHDMHDGTIAQGDAWLRQHLGGYATWSVTHHSMLIVTWDEDDHSEQNRIPTIVLGQGVATGPRSTRLTHYSTLRLLEDLYGLHRLGFSGTAAGIPLP